MILGAHPWESRTLPEHFLHKKRDSNHWSPFFYGSPKPGLSRSIRAIIIANYARDRIICCLLVGIWMTPYTHTFFLRRPCPQPTRKISTWPLNCLYLRLSSESVSGSASGSESLQLGEGRSLNQIRQTKSCKKLPGIFDADSDTDTDPDKCGEFHRHSTNFSCFFMTPVK